MSKAGLARGISALALAAFVAVIATEGAPPLHWPASGVTHLATGQAQAVLRFVKDPEPVPAFAVQSLSGQKLDPAEWGGKVLILNFWATWCGPCRLEVSELVQLQKRNASTLQVIGLSVDEGSPSQVKSFVDHLGINYPVAMASDQLQAKFGGILALPTSFVIDRQGRVVQKHVGLISASYYQEEISYLAGQAVGAKVETFVDEGQIFPTNVKNAKELPGVRMAGLTDEQRKTALRLMNEKHCTCDCNYTVAQCRILDPACAVSLKEAQDIVDAISRGGSATKLPASH
jgi:thiol-disulfide isomerase/thioredoxin